MPCRKVEKMNKHQMRQIAIGAARGVIRHKGLEPLETSAEDALVHLDDMARQHPDRIAAIWYMEASDNQIKAFCREWRKWKRQTIRFSSGECEMSPRGDLKEITLSEAIKEIENK